MLEDRLLVWRFQSGRALGALRDLRKVPCEAAQGGAALLNDRNGLVMLLCSLVDVNGPQSFLVEFDRASKLPVAIKQWANDRQARERQEGGGADDRAVPSVRRRGLLRGARSLGPASRNRVHAASARGLAYTLCRTAFLSPAAISALSPHQSTPRRAS